MSQKTATFIPTRNPAPAVPVVNQSRESRAATFMIAAALLDYPGQEWDEILAQIDSSLGHVSAEAAAEFSQFLEWARGKSRREVEEAYVETFDQKRRCCLELTYYATGDTRQRGIALTIVRDLYAAVGWQLENDQLPDYLPNILELRREPKVKSMSWSRLCWLRTARVLRSFTRHCFRCLRLGRMWLLPCEWLYPR